MSSMEKLAAGILVFVVLGFLAAFVIAVAYRPPKENQVDEQELLEQLLESGYLDKYLDEQGYILKEDIPAFLRSYPEIIEEDAMWEDNVQAYLRSHGWTIVEPKQ